MRALLGMMCLLGLGACAAPSGGPPPARAAQPTDLIGTRWIGVVAEPVDASLKPRLEFVGGNRVSGYTGCNMLSGSWVREGTVAVMGPLVTTKRMCLGPEGEIEKRFTRALAKGSRVTREGKRLVAVGPDGTRFEFTQAEAA